MEACGRLAQHRAMRLTHLLMISTALLPLAASAQTHLTISLYENAGLRPSIVHGMKTETSRIFQAAGVEIEWLDCELAGTPANLSACSEHLGPARFMLQLVSGNVGGLVTISSVTTRWDSRVALGVSDSDFVESPAPESVVD